MKNRRSFIFILVLFSFLACHQENNSKLMIATAANMQFAMAEIVQAFTKETGVDCEIIISSSGKLTAQIKEGAPYDIFLSADMRFPNELATNNLIIGAPKIYAYGHLVLWTMIAEFEPNLGSLDKDHIKYIAIANPKTAPYGLAAMQVLQGLDNFAKVEKKLVFGESVAQTNQFIHSNVADIGFTAKSVVLSEQMNNQGNWINIDVPYTPIAQGVVQLNNRPEQSENAKRFFDFLFSQKSKQILNRFGYSYN